MWVENFPGVGVSQTHSLSLVRNRLIESNSGSSEYFPDPRNEKEAQLGQGETQNISWFLRRDFSLPQ